MKNQPVIELLKTLKEGWKEYTQLKARADLTPGEVQYRDNLYKNIVRGVDAVQTYCESELGITIKGSRDRREPGRESKEIFESKMGNAIERHFSRQRQIIRRKLELWHPDRKSFISWLDDLDIWKDPEFDADLVLILIGAARSGIELFQEFAVVGLDYTLVNAAAAEWARKYTFDLVKAIDTATRASLQKAISAFVETPGMTIGDVMKLLPFDERRAQTVATTEITRAYGTANQLAGEQQAKEYPDLKVIKHWFTNKDSRVCDVCESLNGKEVDIDKEFAPGINNPPAHVNCRCWMDTVTKVKK